MRTMTPCDDGDAPTRTRKAASIAGRFNAPRAGFPGNVHPSTRATATTILRHHCTRLVIVFLLRRRRAVYSTYTEADVLGIPPKRPEVNEGGNSQARTALDSRMRRGTPLVLQRNTREEHPSVHPSHWTNMQNTLGHTHILALGAIEKKSSGGPKQNDYRPT